MTFATSLNRRWYKVTLFGGSLREDMQFRQDRHSSGGLAPPDFIGTALAPRGHGDGNWGGSWTWGWEGEALCLFEIMESWLLLLVALISISPLQGWGLTYLPLWAVFTVLWATLLRKKLCQFFLLVIPQKAELINGFTSPSTQVSSYCLLPVLGAALGQEWSMKPSLCFGETLLTVSGWEHSEQSPAPTYWSAWASKRGRQAWATRDKGHSVTEWTSQCPVFFQWANLPIQPHLEPSSWNAVAESVLLHIMARLCLCDAQVFGFIAAPCPQLGIFFWRDYEQLFQRKRENTVQRHRACPWCSHYLASPLHPLM